MTELNAVGDVVLREPRAMRALADPERLDLHDALRRGGPATASHLAVLLDAQLLEIVAHLEALAKAGLVERREPDDRADQAVWAAIGKGIFFEIPEDAEGQRAARELSNVMFLRYGDVPRRWVSDDEPRLTLAWARAAGLLNVGLLVTPDELRGIQSALEALLEPYLTRAETPDGSARVRLLSYFMPEPAPGERE